MESNTLNTIADRQPERLKRRRWHKVVMALAAVVVFCTTYALILPAFTWQRSLICEKNKHVHTDACYELLADGETKQLVCTKEEHTHTGACFDAPPAEEPGYFCGSIGHTHNKYCYYEDGTLCCTLQEHEHTLVCKSNLKADVESAEDWDASVKDAELAGVWEEDVLRIAETQLGYQESAKNFLVTDENTPKGYTRYGAWYGEPYGDWDLTLFTCTVGGAARLAVRCEKADS